LGLATTGNGSSNQSIGIHVSGVIGSDGMIGGNAEYYYFWTLVHDSRESGPNIIGRAKYWEWMSLRTISFTSFERLGQFYLRVENIFCE
jgi:hypothetical protein